MLASQEAWAAWLGKNHVASKGVWLRIAKKSAGVATVSYPQAVDGALCYGWIDGQKRSDDEDYWLQRFTPRSQKSIWSKINREKALGSIERGLMKEAGLREVERAQQDGRWEDAYDSPRSATISADFQAALDQAPEARAFFAGLESRNRYAVLFRIQTARKPETRAKRIKQFVEMLSRQEKLHP